MDNGSGICTLKFLLFYQILTLDFKLNILENDASIYSKEKVWPKSPPVSTEKPLSVHLDIQRIGIQMLKNPFEFSKHSIF